MADEKKWWEISDDELQHRIEQKQKLQDEPVSQAVAILESAVDKVLNTLGVDTTEEETIAQQMIDLDIIMIEHTDERAPQLNGFYIFTQKLLRSGDYDIQPYAWIGSARLNSLGECFVDVQWYAKEQLTEFGGVRLIKQ
jgi:hypothetical protein